MKTGLISFAAAFALSIAAAGPGFAQDRAESAPRGKIDDKAKPSLPLRTAPRPAPETHGGTLDEGNGKIVFF